VAAVGFENSPVPCPSPVAVVPNAGLAAVCPNKDPAGLACVLPNSPVPAVGVVVDDAKNPDGFAAAVVVEAPPNNPVL
jgi:hypothetical protein